MAQKENKYITISIRVEPSLYQALSEISKGDDRKLGPYCRKVLQEKVASTSLQ